ncbi:Transcriptional adapter ada2 [Rhizina undulata]
MGVIKKKAANPGRVEPGVRYHCDACNADVTFTVRIRCAHRACTDYDLCVPCFSSGAQTGAHNVATHPYQVIEQHSYPIFTDNWGADEELLLLEGAETYGLGSWADIADHIGGGRDKDEVREHYLETYIKSSKFPLPELSDPNDQTFSGISREEFQARKKRRIDKRKEDAAKSTPSAPKKNNTASVPACHEIQGYMPGRMEFETEFDNEAEMAVKDLFFEPGEGLNPITGTVEPEVELKLTVMDIYNGKLTQRAQRKRVMYEHNLLEYRKNTAAEKKKIKEERDLLNKAKPFARMMNKRDFDDFCEGLVKEHVLRQAIGQLQEWRRMGIETLEGGQKYEVEKTQRSEVLRNKLAPLDRLSHRFSNKATPPVEATPINPLVVPKSQPPTSAPSDWRANTPTPVNNIPSSPSPMISNGTKKGSVNGVNGTNGSNGGFPWQPLTLTQENAADLHLLTSAEKTLCSNLRILPKPYLCMKELLLKEAMRHGGNIKKKTAKDLCKIDHTKVSKIHDFFVSVGWIKA